MTLVWLFVILRGVAYAFVLTELLRARRTFVRVVRLLFRLARNLALWGSWRFANTMARGWRTIAERLVRHLDVDAAAAERHRRASAVVDAVQALANVSRGVRAMQCGFPLRGEAYEALVGWRPKASPASKPKEPARCDDRRAPAREQMN